MYERLRKKMPGLAHDNKFSGGDTTTSYSLLSSSSKGSVSSSNFWSKHRDDVSCNQLQKFWSELSLQARHDLLRIDKQTLFEQARKNMYCSRCNGLLLEGFLQIVMYGKSLQQDGTVGQVPCSRHGTSKYSTVEDTCLKPGCIDDVQDPSLHPWGGLTTTRDGTLTLLDCYLYSKSLKGLQNVFGSARARERERELLYPDACGGGGRGWISQGMTGFGRGHGTRETCALHTARLSVDTLVDFWSALGEETRHSLLKMKEEDFMERLMYRFDSKRFCRDCRKNVIREFKELKDLKRMKREARCTTWFCVADTSLQYEVTLDTIQADWHQDHSDSTGTYRYYEWAVGTGEGKCDILEFENVGLNSKVQVNGLDLTGLNACYITLRAWKMDGRCNEVSVKAHALKGQQCVHCRLVVGDGFVTITRGEGIRRFFEHAEEVEEEEDDDSMDKDGNELDGECSRPQKHAKSPELAREFLLDAATVIFKEQVEKAFREGTARQNAHSTFVSLALKLLEERVLVACKDIITLEKQFKLLEEEEKEKRDEEERKERRKAKEKEKKLRRKERLKSKEKERENNSSQPNQIPAIIDTNEEEELTTCLHDDPNASDNIDSLCIKAGEDTMPSVPILEDHIPDEQNSNYDENSNAEFGYEEDENMSFRNDQSKHPRRKLNIWKDYRHDQSSNWGDRRRFEVVSEINKPEPRFHSDSFEPSSRSNNFKPLRSNNLRAHVRSNGSIYSERLHCSHNRMNERDPRACSCYQHNDFRASLGKQESHSDISKPYYRGNKYNNHQTEYVRESCGRPKSKIVTANAISTRVSSHTKQVWEPTETPKRYAPRRTSDSGPVIDPSNGTDSIETHHENNDLKSVDNDVDKTSSMSGTRSSNSNSDSCLSCLSEGDGNTSFSSNTQNPGSSSTSDSEETSLCLENGFREFRIDKQQNTHENETLRAQSYENGIHPRGNIIPPQIQAQGLNFPLFQAPSGGYYHQSPVPWTVAPANGLAPLPHPNHYMFARPFGYGLNPNPHFIQYGVASLPNNGPQPTYQPAPPTILNVSKKLEKGFSTGQHSVEIQNEDTENPQKVNTGFSLFHFGGPVALSNGFKPDTVSRKEEIASGDAAHCCGKDAIEEYNLFAASNGIKFSFF